MAPRRARPAVIFAVGLAFMLLTLLPYLHGWNVTPPGHRFLWTHSLNAGDLYAYLAQIERARQGEILVRNSFTIDTPNHGMLRPTYLLLGWLARASGMPAVGAFHAGRILLGALFFVAFYELAALMLPDPRERWVALVLAATSSGLGWLLRGLLPRSLCPDTWQPELNVFMSLYESPHFTASLLLITSSLLLLLHAAHRACQSGTLRSTLAFAAAAGAVAALLILEHPFDAVTMVLVAGLVLAWACRTLHAPARSAALIGLAWAGTTAPAALFLLARVHSDPVARQWMEQNVLPSPPLLGYVVGFGLLWPLAAWGWLSRRTTPSPLLLLGPWALLGFVLVSLPVPYQRRLAEGWHLPILLLAARGLGELGRRFHGTTVPALWLAVSILAAGTGGLVLQDLRFYGSRRPSAYVPESFSEGVDEVASRVSREDAVLASPFFSYLLTGRSGCHVLAGQRIQAVVLPETARTIEAGLASLHDPTAEAARRMKDLFFGRRVRYLVFEAQRARSAPKVLVFGRAAFTPPPGSRPVWESDHLAIYQTDRLF